MTSETAAVARLPRGVRGVPEGQPDVSAGGQTRTQSLGTQLALGWLRSGRVGSLESLFCQLNRIRACLLSGGRASLLCEWNGRRRCAAGRKTAARAVPTLLATRTGPLG